MTITSSLLRKCSSYNMIMRSGNVLTGSSTRVSSISTSTSISKTPTSKDVMLRSMFTNTNNTTNTGTSISTGTTTNNHQMISKRHLGRKAGKMGKHLETLNEMAHREEHKKAKDKKMNKKKRGNNNKGNEQSQSQTSSQTSSSSMSMGQSSNEIPDIEEDDTETIFDHGGNSNNNDDDDDLTPSLPDKNDVKIRMMKVVNAMEESFKKIRGAEATPELFETVQVKAYGSMSPLNGVAQVVINTPTMATITCFDPDVAPDVRDAVRDMAGLNFNPRIEDGVVLVPIPRVSAETRKALVKQLGKTAENTKQRLRRIRRAAQDVVKKAKDGKLEGISEDDSFRTGKEIDAVTEECINALNEVVDTKQASVMNV